MKKYSRSRAVAQIAAASLKGAIVPTGTVLAVAEIVEGELDNGQPNDVMLCSTESGNIRVPVREFLKMNAGEGKHFVGEEGSDEVELAAKFKITGAEPRKDRDGDPVFPIFAYNLGQAQLDAGEIDWAALKAGGLKAGNKLDQVQNYTIEIL